MTYSVIYEAWSQTYATLMSVKLHEWGPKPWLGRNQPTMSLGCTKLATRCRNGRWDIWAFGVGSVCMQKKDMRKSELRHTIKGREDLSFWTKVQVILGSESKEPPSIGLLVQKVKEQESKVTVVAYAIMSEFEPKHQNLHTLKNTVLKKYFKNWLTTLEFLMQFGIPGCWQKDLSVILWLILKCWWEESCTSLSTGSVSRVDVCIAGVQEAPDQNDF